ncbi:ribosomal L1 domain-containing protein 1-like [Watersipora subatra]|uniref:ribosomal L1 domain-containing protein 1-like n=1 Tax=Watersipora subatra TaxID=2589382 RepID=UPI00355C8B89
MDTITNEQILKAITFLRQEKEKKSDLFAGVQRFTLQVCMFKLPVLPKDAKNSQLVRVVLPHMLPNVDACLIVSDGENKKDRTKIEETIQHYEQLLNKEKITEIKEIIPLLKMKLEYQTFEAKSALATSYNLVLADASVYRFLPPLLGKAFHRKKRTPVQVSLQGTGVGKRLKQSLRTQLCELSFKGANNSVVVGEGEMTDEEIAENVKAAVTKLAEVLPGGENNIFKFNLRLHDSIVLPIYISGADRASVPVPPLPEMYENQGETLEDEVSTVKGKVTIKPDGSVIITKADGRKEVIRPDTEKTVPSVNIPPRKTQIRRGRRGHRGGLAKKKSVTGKPAERARKRLEKMRSKPLSSNKVNPITGSQPDVEVNAKSPALGSSASKKRKLEAPSTPAHLSPKQSHQSQTQETSAAATPTAKSINMKSPLKSGKKSVKTPGKAKSPVKSKTPAKTTANETTTAAKTPAKQATTAANTPAKLATTAAKTSAKQATLTAKTPAKQATPTAKTPPKQTTPTAKTPAKQATPTAKTPAKQSTPTAKKLAKVSMRTAKTPAKESCLPIKKSSSPVTPLMKRSDMSPAHAANSIRKTPRTGSRAVKETMKTPKSDSKLKVTKTPLKTPTTSKKMKA